VELVGHFPRFLQLNEVAGEQVQPLEPVAVDKEPPSCLDAAEAAGEKSFARDDRRPALSSVLGGIGIASPQFSQVVVEAVEAGFPVLAVEFEKVRDLAHRRRLEPARTPLASLPREIRPAPSSTFRCLLTAAIDVS
jgi:hypothetical protein